MLDKPTRFVARRPAASVSRKRPRNVLTNKASTANAMVHLAGFEPGVLEQVADIAEQNAIFEEVP